jgi:mannose-6-phosphate isomerase-like protein (cupin superfamily)
MEDGTATTRLQPDAENRFVRLRHELGVTSFGLNQIVLHPGQRGRIHAHERQEEVYLVLEGTLSLLVEGEESTHEQGKLVRVAPNVRRQLVNRGPASTRAATARRGRRGTRPRAALRRRCRCPTTCPRRSSVPSRRYCRLLQSPSPVGSRASAPSKNSIIATIVSRNVTNGGTR